MAWLDRIDRDRRSPSVPLVTVAGPWVPADAALGPAYTALADKLDGCASRIVVDAETCLISSSNAGTLPLNVDALLQRSKASRVATAMSSAALSAVATKMGSSRQVGALQDFVASWHMLQLASCIRNLASRGEAMYNSQLPTSAGAKERVVERALDFLASSRAAADAAIEATNATLRLGRHDSLVVDSQQLAQVVNSHATSLTMAAAAVSVLRVPLAKHEGQSAPVPSIGPHGSGAVGDLDGMHW